MSLQPSDSQLLADQLERARRELDSIDRDRLAAAITSTWEALADEGHHRGRTVAVALLYQAASIRRRDAGSKLADSIDRCAEAFVIQWANEVDVLAALVDLDRA